MKLNRLKQATLAAFATAVLLASACGQVVVTSVNDLHYWGTGSNHSALVISWNDGKANSTVAWGYSWNGSAKVADMVLALATADPHLFTRIDSATGFGLGIFGLGYDANGNSVFSVTGAVDSSGNPTTPVFTTGISDMNTDPTKVQAPFSSINAASGEAADHYAEGWFDRGFWGFYTGGASPTYPVSWTDAMDGVSGTTLVDNGWFALSFSNPDFTSNLPGAAVAAVPEPATLVLAAIGFGAMLWRRKRRNA
ncbi:MAG: PEP-CTERM sorting domain-containing protein [Terrimicrobiaceae bacterium]|nr:PEP-CTERM sorting domain-containing protein [Terrimicrobiaceae bacterium]